MIHTLARLLVFSAAFALAGCGGAIERSLVGIRNHQGDVAMEGGHMKDASIAYRLALQLAPNDEHARSGMATVQLEIADEQYRESLLDEALAAVAVAEKYDPQSVRAASLRSEIEQAKVKREIVIANYPLYRQSGAQIRKAYAELTTQNATIVKSLKRFDYTYDANALTDSIRGSYQLGAELSKLTNRLIVYRTAIQSGSSPRGVGETLPGAGSLLPLP